MYPYTKLMTKTFILLFFVSRVEGLCYDYQQKCCNLTDCDYASQCSWSSSTWIFVSNVNQYETSLSQSAKWGDGVDSPLFCPTSIQHCLTFQYYTRHAASLTVSLPPQMSSEVHLPQSTNDTEWTNASLLLSNTNKSFNISITASLYHSQSQVGVKNIVFTKIGCPTTPAQTRQTTVASTIQQTTVLTISTAVRSSSSLVTTIEHKKTVKVTSTSTDSLTETTPTLTTTVNNSRHHAPGASDAKKSDVISPVTAVVVSVSVVTVTIVVVTVIVFVKRRKMCCSASFVSPPAIEVKVDNQGPNDATHCLTKTSGQTLSTSDQKADNSPYNVLNLPGGAATLPRGSHDVYSHLTEEEGTYNHVNAGRKMDDMNDEYSHIQPDSLSSET